MSKKHESFRSGSHALPGPGLRYRPIAVWLAVFGASVAIVASAGCQPADVQLDQGTPSAIRAARRAFYGAPPVIPHVAFGASCVTCHTATGGPMPPAGVAPANPHASTSAEARMTNCRQCHLFRNAEDTFRETQFVGLPTTVSLEAPAWPGAPPRIPHDSALRENCLACHTGAAARPEIRCSHPDRRNCRQCHLYLGNSSTFPPADDSASPAQPPR